MEALTDREGSDKADGELLVLVAGAGSKGLQVNGGRYQGDLGGRNSDFQ
jgi:hypothetical protein